jgi:hypothetical protein
MASYYLVKAAKAGTNTMNAMNAMNTMNGRNVFWLGTLFVLF